MPKETPRPDRMSIEERQRSHYRDTSVTDPRIHAVAGTTCLLVEQALADSLVRAGDGCQGILYGNVRHVASDGP